MDHASNETYDPYRAGVTIGDSYRLDGLAGEGGMGSVWVATNLRLGTPVALKLIRRDVHGPGAAQRLLREARAAAQLRHPAIVRVFDFGETHHGDPFIVMELLDGESLRDLLCRTGRLRPEQAVRILLPIAGALAAAHQRGIVHRDLKPENVFLARDDGGRIQPKLVDFGVAKIVRAWPAGVSTGVGLIGTPEYMAPEQAMALDVDHRADIWAFCVVLHELITDAYVFSGETPEKTLNDVVYAEPASLLGINGVDEALSNIISRGLSKEPESRYRHIDDLARALARWLSGRGVIDDVCGASLRTSYAFGGGPDEPAAAVSEEPVAAPVAQATVEQGKDSDPDRTTLVRAVMPVSADQPLEKGLAARMRARLPRLPGPVLVIAVLVALVCQLWIEERPAAQPTEATAAETVSVPVAASAASMAMSPACGAFEADESFVALADTEQRIDASIAEGSRDVVAGKGRRIEAPKHALKRPERAEDIDFGF